MSVHRHGDHVHDHLDGHQRHDHDDLSEDDGYVEVEPDWLARACDAAHVADGARAAGHVDGFCRACAELRARLAATYAVAERPWEDRHEVRVPAPCSLDRAFDGEAEPQRRELRPLERDVLCRLLGDVLYRVGAAGSVDALVWADFGLATGGGVRLDPWEVPLLLNLVEVLQPRSEANW